MESSGCILSDTLDVRLPSKRGSGAGARTTLEETNTLDDLYPDPDNMDPGRGGRDLHFLYHHHNNKGNKRRHTSAHGGAGRYDDDDLEESDPLENGYAAAHNRREPASMLGGYRTVTNPGPWSVFTPEEYNLHGRGGPQYMHGASGGAGSGIPASQISEENLREARDWWHRLYVSSRQWKTTHLSNYLSTVSATSGVAMEMLILHTYPCILIGSESRLCYFRVVN